MNSQEIRQAANRFVAKEKQRRSLDRARWEEAERDARRILDLCVRSNPTRIFQWGSVLHPEHFREWSDIDFALEGLDRPETLFRLQAECEAITRFPVHLVEMERIEPEYAESIRANGRVVYER